MNRAALQITARMISAEWQDLLDRRLQRQHDACATLERPKHGAYNGRDLILRNGGRTMRKYLSEAEIELSAAAFVHTILRPAMESWATEASE